MNESWYIALFVVSGFIKYLSLIDYVNIYLFFLNIFFNRFSPVERCGVTPHCLYCDSLSLIYHISSNRCRTLAAPLSTRIEVSFPPTKSAALLQ